jgi:hypothetical protein
MSHCTHGMIVICCVKLAVELSSSVLRLLDMLLILLCQALAVALE